MGKLWTLCVFLMAAHEAWAFKCGHVISYKNTTKGSFKGPPENYQANEACNLTISRAASYSYTTVQLNEVSVASGDVLLVYDGPHDLLANLTDESVTGKVLVSFQRNITFLFTSLDNTTRSTWSVNFNTKDCKVTFDNTWTTSLDSPTYLKGKRQVDLSCTYTLVSFLPHQFIVAAAFTDFTLTGESQLEVTGAQGKTSYTADSPRPLHDFFAEGFDPLVLELDIKNTTVRQGFSLMLEPVLKDCSGVHEVSGSLVVATDVSTAGPRGTCRWLLKAQHLPLLHAEISSLALAPPGSGDMLTFRSGGSSRSVAVDMVDKSVNDYLVVTNDDTMLVALTLGLVGKDQRSLNVTFMEAAFGGRIEGQGSLSVNETTVFEDVFFHLIASPGQWVDVARFSNLTSGSVVQFFDGAQRSSPLLTQWSKGDQDLTSVTGHQQMLVVLSNLATGEFFSASFTSIAAGCDMLTSAASGSQTFNAVSSLSSDETCSWTVHPMSISGTVVISLSSVSLRKKEALTVTSGLGSSSQVLAKFTGPYANVGSPLPQIYMSAAEIFRVTFTRLGAASASTSASVQYKTLTKACGGELSAPVGTIKTPNYPNQYPLNAACRWTVPAREEPAASPTSLLLMSFSDLALAQHHNISVLQHMKNKSEMVPVATYGGLIPSPSRLPGDLILPDAPNLAVAFSSQPNSAASKPGSMNQVAGGASLNYWILGCGGNITDAQGFFTSPEFSKPPTKSSLCVWILNVAGVKGPKNATNILSFTINAIGKDAKSLGQYLKIYDGPSLRSPLYLLSSSSSNLSRYDSIVVLFNLTVFPTNRPDVRLKFTYQTKSCNTSEQCANGICMHHDWICNGHDDCGDDSDEQNCVIPPPTQKPPKPAPPQSKSGLVKVGWVPGCLFIGLVLGACLVFFGPRLIQRLRGQRSGSYNRMEEPVV